MHVNIIDIAVAASMGIGLSMLETRHSGDVFSKLGVVFGVIYFMLS